MGALKLLFALLVLSAFAWGGVVDAGSFVYLGAFTLPRGGERPFTFQYGGEAMTFCPTGNSLGADDGFPGSLFIMGHNSMPYGELPGGNLVAEVDIPVPIIASRVESLNRAVFLQGFTDVSGGLFDGLDEIPRAGMEYLDTRATGPLVHLCRGQHLQDSPRASHGWFSPDLSAPDTRGAWFIGDYSLYSTNDYLFSAPSDWASEHTGGRMLLTGRYRDGGWSGMGPSLYAYRPWTDDSGTPHAPQSRLEGVVLLGYDSSFGTERISNCLAGYQHADEWTGGAWVTDGRGNEAVLFAGTRGTGEYYWYGYISSLGPEHPFVEREMIGDFTLCRRADGSPVGAEVSRGEPASTRGWWSSSFSPGFLLYDPSDLARVASGEMEPWEPQPSSFVGIDEHLFLSAGVEPEMLGSGVQRRFRLGDAAWDRENRLLYVLELFAEGAAPVVHVWRVD